VDGIRFDGLVRGLGRGTSRRGALGLLAAAAGLGLREVTAKTTRHRQGKGNGKGTKKRGCAPVGQQPHTGPRTGCCAGLRPDATGRCAAPEAPTSPPSTPCVGLQPTDNLQHAIDATAPGATLTLCPGTWALTSTILIAKNKRLTLIGAGAGQSILDGGKAVQVLYVFRDAVVTVQNLTITKGDVGKFSSSNVFGGGSATRAP
jgi:hypothetical protein